jgi:hypothetical protein
MGRLKNDRLRGAASGRRICVHPARYQSYAVGGGAREYQYSMGGRGRGRLQRPGFFIHPGGPAVNLARSGGGGLSFQSPPASSYSTLL